MHECVFSFKSNFFQWCSVVFNGQVLHSSKPLLFDAGSRAVPTGDLMIKSHSRTLSVWRLVSLVVKENWRAYLYDSSPLTFLLLVCILNSLGTGPVCRTYQLICCHLYGFSTIWKIKDTEKRGFGAWQNFLVSRLLAVWSGASYFIWAAVFSFFNWGCLGGFSNLSQREHLGYHQPQWVNFLDRCLRNSPVGDCGSFELFLAFHCVNFQIHTNAVIKFLQCWL